MARLCISDCPLTKRRGGPTRRAQRGEPKEGIAVQASASGRSDNRPECTTPAKCNPRSSGALSRNPAGRDVFCTGSQTDGGGLARPLWCKMQPRGGPAQWTGPPFLSDATGPTVSPTPSASSCAILVILSQHDQLAKPDLVVRNELDEVEAASHSAALLVAAVPQDLDRPRP